MLSFYFFKYYIMNGQCNKCSKWPSGEPPYAPRKWNESGGNILGSHNCYSYMLNDLFPGPRKYHKPQPGWFYKLKSKDNTYSGINKLNCAETIKGVKLDNPDNLKILSIKKGSKFIAPPFHYKGMLVVSPDRDYHFTRQDNRLLKVYDKIHNHTDLSDVQLIRLMLQLSEQYLPEIWQYLPKRLTKLKQKLRFLYKNSKTWSHKPGSSSVTDKDGDGKLIFDPLKANWDFSKNGGINYSQNCCFFSIPMNTHLNTFSTGTPMMSMGASIPTMKARTNISSTQKHQLIDKRVRKLLR
jgi:hypothetical protein